MLILRRPWLALDVPVTQPISAYLPYGSAGKSRAELRCGLIPSELLDQILEHLRAALPNEAAVFVIWNELAGTFDLDFPFIEDASPSRLVYRTPILGPDWHIVCDIHSRGIGPAFFSSTDDADDAHATKISIVFGQLDQPDGPMTKTRLCAAGMFLPMPRNPFSGGDHAA